MVQKDSPIRVAHEHASPPINGSEVVASFPASEQLPGVQYVSPSARGWFASPGTSTRATVQATRRPNRKVTNKFQRPERRLEPRRILRGIPDLLAYCRVFDKFSYCNPRPFRRREEELSGLLDRVEVLLAKGGDVRMEGNALVVSPLEAEERPESTVELERLIDERLPLVELSELLIEVDGWTHFSDETLKAATTRLVNFQYRQPLSRFWGTGTLSSSDGQRFPVSGKVRMATALPRYFGYGKGVTLYTWTADQFSQYGTKVIPATVRDATYVLDEILDNETELPILEHTTDTAGYTEIVFALFDLLGLQFSPRIRDLSDQRLFRLDRQKRHPHLAPLLRGRINRDRILRNWDDLLRVAGSLKRGWVTASLLIGKLQSYPRKNRLTRALQEYGRLAKTVFILRYLESEDYRRRILGQLNKGEALHSLREFLLFANKGTLQRKQEEELARE